MMHEYIKQFLKYGTTAASTWLISNLNPTSIIVLALVGVFLGYQYFKLKNRELDLKKEKENHIHEETMVGKKR